MSDIELDNKYAHQRMASTPRDASVSPVTMLSSSSAHRLADPVPADVNVAIAPAVQKSTHNKTLCDCAVCVDVHGDARDATRWEQAARAFRKFNRSLIGTYSKHVMRFT